jgi:hypothetical protein
MSTITMLWLNNLMICKTIALKGLVKKKNEIVDETHMDL